MKKDRIDEMFKIRAMMIFFIVAVLLSGITAFDAEGGLHWLLKFKDYYPHKLSDFMQKSYEGLRLMNQDFPMIAYAFDWLAFAHIVIAALFIGVYKNPVKNQWVIKWAMFVCIAVIPLALIAGPIRTIPFYWRMIDCSFGLLGIIPLYIANQWINKLK